jgi:hypothetical protein
LLKTVVVVVVKLRSAPVVAAACSAVTVLAVRLPQPSAYWLTVVVWPRSLPHAR